MPAQDSAPEQAPGWELRWAADLAGGCSERLPHGVAQKQWKRKAELLQDQDWNQGWGAASRTSYESCHRAGMPDISWTPSSLQTAYSAAM